MNPSHTDHRPGISETQAGWLIGAVIVIDCLVLAAVGIGIMCIFG